MCYNLHSIQQFDGNYIGVYVTGATPRTIRNGLRDIGLKGTPKYAIFTKSKGLHHGKFNLYENNSSFEMKNSEADGCVLLKEIVI